MWHKFISVSKAKMRLLELVRNANEAEEAYLLTKDGEPIGALVPLEDYEALLKTADVLLDPATLNFLEQALEDESKSRMWKRDTRGQGTKAKKSKKIA